MLKQTFLSLLALAFAANLSAAEGWLTDIESAKAKAAEENKMILVEFTGSDWCYWCKKLVGEVTSKEEFMAYAKDNFVLLKVDLPRDKSIVGGEENFNKNRELVEEYGIRGFPTVMVLKDTGQPIAKTGYQPGGPTAYINHLKELLSRAG